MIRIGIVGLGAWGTNIIRNFYALGNTVDITVYDVNPDAARVTAAAFPGVRIARSFQQILASNIDAVVIATYPWETHYVLGRQALESGKHVWLEKPFALTAASARDLITIAEQHRVLLHVDHTFLYDPAVTLVRDIIAHGDVGTVRSVAMLRANTSARSDDCNVFWDLAIHDFSILFFWFGSVVYPTAARSIVATSDKRQSQGAIAYTVPSGISIRIDVSSISNKKARNITIVGSKKILMYNQLDNAAPVVVYPATQNGKIAGNAEMPIVKPIEPLALEVQHFIRCIEYRDESKTSGRAAFPVVEQLEFTLRHTVPAM